MARSKINDTGLLLYFTSYNEIKKIDNAALGDLIKKELFWRINGMPPEQEPEFQDTRCDCFHMGLMEEVVIREKAAEEKARRRAEKEKNKNKNK